MPVMPQDKLALDRASVRTIDQDGHLHVAESNISRAAVNGYLGREIPEAEALGLQPDRMYQLYRDPAELEKAAASFNGKPLLIVHKPQTAADHDRELTVGSVNNVKWSAPYLTAELAVWDATAIAGITSGDQQELSAAYRYKAVMEPGDVNGVHFDGRMIDIAGNHIALVTSGRAGPDVIVGDSALSQQETGKMATPAALTRTALLASGAIIGYLKPKLAADGKIDLRPMLATVSKKTWKADKPKLKLALDAAVAGKLAKDADIGDVVNLLDQLDNAVDDVADGTDQLQVTPPPAVDAEGLSTEEEAQYQTLLAKRKPVAADADPPVKPGEKDPPAITKPAMDAAIAKARTDTETATITRMRDIQTAERAVRPFIGEVVIAQDSAPAVYKLALDAAAIDLTGVHESAYAAMVRMLPLPGSTPVPIAQDAAGAKDFATRFPGASKLKQR